MNGTTPREDDPAVRNYFAICLGGLALLFLLLLRRDLGLWSCLPVALGLVGAWQRWRLAPLMILIAVIVLLIWHEPLGDASRYARRLPRVFQLPDWLLSIALLAYAAAHYRLQALTHSIFPTDLRRQPVPRHERGISAQQVNSQENVPRQPHPGTGSEIGMLLLALPLCGMAAQLVWRLLPIEGFINEGPYLRRRVWQGMVGGWCVMLILFVGHGILRYLGWQRLTPREARLVVQDTLWQETRREQRRLQYWLAWARLRRKRRKERS
jgi:hypothetical protein